MLHLTMVNQSHLDKKIKIRETLTFYIEARVMDSGLVPKKYALFFNFFIKFYKTITSNK